jgi:hypothetical protein
VIKTTSEDTEPKTRDNPLLGSGEEPTTDALEFKERKNKRRQKLLETREIENEASDARKNSTDDGNVEKNAEIPSDIANDDYPFKEGRKTPRAEKTESESKKSPLQ